MLDSGVEEFLDDILMYSHMLKEDFMLLKKVLEHLYQYIFYSKLKKCSFLYSSVMFFGFDAKPKGMHISDLKVWSLNELAVPITVK